MRLDSKTYKNIRTWEVLYWASSEFQPSVLSFMWHQVTFREKHNGNYSSRQPWKDRHELPARMERLKLWNQTAGFKHHLYHHWLCDLGQAASLPSEVFHLKTGVTDVPQWGYGRAKWEFWDKKTPSISPGTLADTKELFVFSASL